MDAIESVIRTIVREELSQHSAAVPSEPEMIRLDEAARILAISESTVDELHRDRAANGFPSVQLGPRTVRVDKRRLNVWIAAGGLGVGA